MLLSVAHTCGQAYVWLCWGVYTMTSCSYVKYCTGCCVVPTPCDETTLKQMRVEIFIALVIICKGGRDIVSWVWPGLLWLPCRYVAVKQCRCKHFLNSGVPKFPAVRILTSGMSAWPHRIFSQTVEMRCAKCTEWRSFAKRLPSKFFFSRITVDMHMGLCF